MAVASAPMPISELLRSWRRRRNLSQLDLALGADVSARHVSFLETGRARPSREMVIRLAEELEIPLRERNSMLLAAGYAPIYEQRPLEAPEMATVAKLSIASCARTSPTRRCRGPLPQPRRRKRRARPAARRRRPRVAQATRQRDPDRAAP